MLSDAQVRALLGCIRNPIHKACFTLMYACGLRISEAATLEVKAIDSASLVLRIIGKGDKERRVPLPQPVLDDLRRLWLTHRHPRWLFPNHLGTNPANRQVLGHTFRAAARAAGITRSGTPHCGIAMRRGSLKAASTQGSSKFCSATSTSRPLPSTPI